MGCWEGHFVIVVILASAVLGLFVISLVSSFMTNQKRRS
jgi:uncharacterized membrane protein (DUF106 family)